ncbi:MAG: DUF4363 family protein [Oscillibacter sp.]|nr:DUF4363 family protein [Oscillibacter sp.]
MTKGYRIPVITLAALLLFSLWNARILSGHCRNLLEQLDRAEQYARAQQWTQAADAVRDGYRDWQSRKTYLRVVSRHDASNGADTLYQQCVLYAGAGDEVHFLTELQALREQIETLTEMEQLSIGNVL